MIVTLNDIDPDTVVNKEMVPHFKNLTEGLGMTANCKSKGKLLDILKNVSVIITTNKLPRAFKFEEELK